MEIENKLCYSQNVFPATGEVVERTARIAENFNKIKDALKISSATSFPLGLWLDATSAAKLADSQIIANLKGILTTNHNTVFTVNAFPYGRFHSIGVKENVYLPDWTLRERVDYTLCVADALVELLPAGMIGSISTLPGGYRKETQGNEAESGENGKWKNLEEEHPTSNIQNVGKLKARNAIAMGKKLEMIAANLREVAEYLAAIFTDKGKKIILAVEMEPDCLWESPAEFIKFRNQYLIAHPAAEEFIGVCYDTCHQELLGEIPGAGLELLEKSGVPIPKIQLSAAINRDICGEDDLTTAFKELAKFADGVYLHQTRLISYDSNVLIKFEDIPSYSTVKNLFDDGAFYSKNALSSNSFKLVSHFHTPIHMDQLSDGLRTAKNELTAVLKILSKRPANELPHLEIETYTYNVLPKELREASLLDSMTNEYRWVMEHFEK